VSEKGVGGLFDFVSFLFFYGNFLAFFLVGLGGGGCLLCSALALLLGCSCSCLALLVCFRMPSPSPTLKQ